MWLHNPAVQKSLGGGLIERMAFAVVAGFEMLHMRAHKDPEILDRIRDMRKTCRSLTTANESFLLYSIARAQARLDGAMAEVGCYDGGSTRMICEGKGARELHVFDTFSGLPELTSEERKTHTVHQYTASLESVQKLLSPFPQVHIHAGLFPGTAGPIENLRFSFAHFDVDLYQATLDCLNFFYPRMLPGGIMLSHDYSVLAGVRRAFDEFLEGKPEDIIELPTTQCMLIKR